MMLSDEELERIARIIADAGGDIDEWTLSAGWDALDERGRAIFLATAHAVRAALTPDVAPLAPGEIVRIPLATGQDGDELTVTRMDKMHVQAYNSEDRNETIIALDAGGVQALRLACDRFLAGQDGDDAAEE